MISPEWHISPPVPSGKPCGQLSGLRGTELRFLDEELPGVDTAVFDERASDIGGDDLFDGLDEMVEVNTSGELFAPNHLRSLLHRLVDLLGECEMDPTKVDRFLNRDGRETGATTTRGRFSGLDKFQANAFKKVDLKPNACIYLVASTQIDKRESCFTEF